jgi:hypothetical protein
MSGTEKTGTQALSAITIIHTMDRIAALFKRLGDLEGKMKRYSAGDGDAGTIPSILATQLHALRLCAAISEEVREAEELLGRRR